MQMLVADCTPVTKQCNQSKVKRELDETIPVETACSIDSSKIGLSVFEIKRHNTTNVSIQFQSHKHCTNSCPSKRNDCWRIEIRRTAYVNNRYIGKRTIKRTTEIVLRNSECLNIIHTYAHKHLGQFFIYLIFNIWFTFQCIHHTLLQAQ